MVSMRLVKGGLSFGNAVELGHKQRFGSTENPGHVIKHSHPREESSIPRV